MHIPTYSTNHCVCLVLRPQASPQDELWDFVTKASALLGIVAALRSLSK